LVPHRLTAGILAQPIGRTRFDATAHGDAAGASGVALGQWQRGGLLVGGGSVQGKQGEVLFAGQGLGTLAQILGELRRVAGKIVEEDLLLPEVAFDAAAMVEEAGFAGEA
jgi:hypothetical protein